MTTVYTNKSNHANPCTQRHREEVVAVYREKLERGPVWWQVRVHIEGETDDQIEFEN